MRETKRERERKRVRETKRERERKRVRERDREKKMICKDRDKQ